MNREDIIAMALECGWSKEYLEIGDERLERFAALVASAERNRTWTQDHWTEYEHAIVAQEREACAKVCEQYENDMGYGQPQKCADAVRARGQA